MKALGYLFFFTLIPFYFLKSPETHQDVTKHEDKKVKLDLPKTGELCICLLFFFYIAEEVGYANWVPTYAYKSGSANAK